MRQDWVGLDPVPWLQLIRSRRVGPATFHRMIREHGDAQTALAALPDIAAAAGVEDYVVCPAGVAAAELAKGARAGATFILWGQAGYPSALMDLADAPPILWAQGDIGGRAQCVILGIAEGAQFGGGIGGGGAGGGLGPCAWH